MVRVKSPREESPDKTEIIIEPEELREEYPFCRIPPYFFEAAKSASARGRARNLLSIQTWDGRKVMSVEGQDQDH